ncbi:(Lyso)-N-acylphosphatidylethanolamine lipase-like [Palaemon carinicauda]|uniref:(Lyso)-N-acylphosphatidylethanolamine lipase-like n=1 Tax=Palaemon carinicauda TaxID=392227 RepID=UPI0035B6A250
MAGFGWAKYPMIQQMESLRKEVPITLIYGSRSWIDRDPGFQMKYMRPNSYVDVQVIQGAGHHVYADRANVFNDRVNTVGHYVDTGVLPSLPDISINEQEDAKNVTQTLASMLNVRNDETQDEFVGEPSHSNPQRDDDV